MKGKMQTSPNFLRKLRNVPELKEAFKITSISFKGMSVVVEAESDLFDTPGAFYDVVMCKDSRKITVKRYEKSRSNQSRR